MFSQERVPTSSSDQRVYPQVTSDASHTIADDRSVAKGIQYHRQNAEVATVRGAGQDIGRHVGPKSD